MTLGRSMGGYKYTRALPDLGLVGPPLTLPKVIDAV